MGFLAPLMLLGLVGASIPILIHLFGRKQAKRIRFAALDFLLSTDEQLARTLRIRDRLLLAARILVCVAFALALAKPFASCQSVGLRVATGPQAVVLVVDNSATGESLLDEIREQAHTVLDRLDPRSQAAIVFTAGLPKDVALSSNFSALKKQVDAMPPTPRAGDLDAAMQRAAALLRLAPQAQKTAYLLAPLVRGRMISDTTRWPDDAGDLELAFPETTLANVGIVQVDANKDPTTETVSLQITVRSWSETTETRDIVVRHGDQVLARRELSLAPGGVVKTSFAVGQKDQSPGTGVEIALTPDSVPWDDSHHLLLDQRRDISVLIVNGSPSDAQRADELFYLTTALRPGDRGESGIRWRTVARDQLQDQSLEGIDVLVLANVQALDASVAKRLVAYVEAGGGVFVSVGDQVDPDAYNRTMSALLPQPLANPIELAYGKEASRAWRLRKLDHSHPILSVFPQPAKGLQAAEFRKVMLLGPTTDVAKREVVAYFDGGGVALAASAVGRGRTLLFTSTIDRDWNSLALYPSYLPLVQQCVRYLARRSARGAGGRVVGDAVVLPKAHAPYVITTPDGRSLTQPSSRDTQVRFLDTQLPGVYRVSVESERRLDLDFTVHPDPRAGDTSPVTVTYKQPTPGVEKNTHSQRLELWHALAWLLLGVLVVEGLLVVRQRAHQ